MTPKPNHDVKGHEELGTLLLVSKNATPTDKLISNFFEKTSADEISDALSSMLDTHLQHSDEDRLSLANKTNLVLKMQQLFYQLQSNVQ